MKNKILSFSLSLLCIVSVLHPQFLQASNPGACPGYPDLSAGRHEASAPQAIPHRTQGISSYTGCSNVYEPGFPSQSWTPDSRSPYSGTPNQVPLGSYQQRMHYSTSSQGQSPAYQPPYLQHTEPVASRGQSATMWVADTLDQQASTDDQNLQTAMAKYEPGMSDEYALQILEKDTNSLVAEAQALVQMAQAKQKTVAVFLVKARRNSSADKSVKSPSLGRAFDALRPAAVVETKRRERQEQEHEDSLKPAKKEIFLQSALCALAAADMKKFREKMSTSTDISPR